MKALVKTAPGFGHLEMMEYPDPKPGKDEVKIEVKFVGICGTDLHSYEGYYKNITPPVILGHEFSGQIVEVGENVTEFQIGDRVTSETTYYVCRQCPYCQTKDYNLCPHRKGLGTQQNGAFAKYVIAKKESLHKIPDELDYRSAAMTEPLACTYHAIEKANVRAGNFIVVIGPGPIGLLTAQVAKSRGAKVMIIGLTKDRIRLDKAKELGVDYAVDSQQEDAKELVHRLTDGWGADIVFECTGAAPAANQGLDLLRKKGIYVQVGIFPESFISFDMEKVIQKEIHVIGTRSQKPSDWEPSLALMNEGKVKAKDLVTHEFNIDQWDLAYQAIKNGEAIKVLLKPID
ncbi:zinc-binding dehydrogenase [Geobacillus kaustophilus]|uniref:zinc-binding dehydrogenase n=1 Tax=Geobacillus kaustophilus TaxID=1462 RepID=UPI002E22E297|nr:zinc-binding dehydrogenase [Geobacillus kaustophilus]